jgi:hypothetical protein
MKGKLLQFKAKHILYPKMEEVLRVLRDSDDGHTLSELCKITGDTGSNVSKTITRLKGYTETTKDHRMFPIRIQTHRKRSCQVTGRKTPVWIDIDRFAL